MTQVGGSATIYGVMYQILGVVRWATSIHLVAEPDKGDFSSARLTIEPSGGGGDIQVSGYGRIIEQWKAKSDHGTWSVRQLVADVFPDLYRAVDVNDLNRPCSYRFVTEGRAGKWTELNSFLDKVKNSDVPSDPLKALDDVESKGFLRNEPYTESGFLLWMSNTLGDNHPDIKVDSEDVRLRKIWHVLSHFEFVPSRTCEALCGEIDHILRGVVDYDTQVEPKRRELYGLILELGSRGNVEIAPKELLLKVGLSAQSLADWTGLRERLKKHLAEELAIQWRYLLGEDVRSAPAWSSNKPILVLAGESGLGKTWQLASCALQIFSTNGIAAIASATGDAERDLSTAVRMIWQSVLKHDESLSLERFGDRRREVVPNVSGPWLTILIDDVQSVDEARRLCAKNWKALGARLAVSTLPPIAQTLKSAYPDHVEVIDVREFSLLELQAFLEHHGLEWGLIQRDVRELLSRPLLAKLFCEVVGDAQWSPVYEYELFERYWLRIRDAHSQTNHPGDSESMRRLAATVLDGPSVYPWPQKALTDATVAPEVQVRLETVGWLRRLDGDRVEVWHNRVLNWAVAEALVSRRQAGTITTVQLGEQIAKLFDIFTSPSGMFLQYVPMDVLWLSSDQTRGFANEVSTLLTALEQTPMYRGYPEGLYEWLLPTLGFRIVGSMLERVRQTVNQEFNPYPRFAAAAVSKIGMREPQEVAALGRKLLNDPLQDVREVGLRILAKYPVAGAFDKLWSIHCEIYKSYQAQEEGAVRKYEISFSALRLCVHLDPTPLLTRIEQADNNEPASELAYLVASLEGHAGSEIWLKVKNLLFTKVPVEKCRSLVRCIEQHADRSEIHRLEKWLTEKRDRAAPAALAALVRLDPDTALAGLKLLPHIDLYVTRGWWIRELFFQKAAAAEAVILNLMRENPEQLWNIALVYSGNEDLIGTQTLDFLLDALESLLVQNHELKDAQSPPNLWHPLGLLAELNRPEHFERFEARAGSALEDNLLIVASKHVSAANGWLDHELANIWRILLRINGRGITQLVNLELGGNKSICSIAWSRVVSGQARQIEPAATRNCDGQRVGVARQRSPVHATEGDHRLGGIG